MATKKGKGFSGMDLDNIGKVINPIIKPDAVKKIGRPKLNPYADEKKITVMIPEKIHRQLRIAAAETGRPMVEIVVEALIKHLKPYQDR